MKTQQYVNETGEEQYPRSSHILMLIWVLGATAAMNRDCSGVSLTKWTLGQPPMPPHPS